MKLIIFGIILIIITESLVACSILPRSWRRQSHFTAKDLQSENPVTQIQAIESIAQSGDLDRVPDLIELMLSEEPSVRNHAYWGVTELTSLLGPDTEKPIYHFYDPLPERQISVLAWKEYWRTHAPGK